jgi:mannose-1-phosphate guanylyltransferase
MGEIGKVIPKPMWPLFQKNLLELQVDFCRELGVKKIFINVHFLAEEIVKFLKDDSKFSDIVILEEDPLLDSGGAVHNLASKEGINYAGNLLYVNADQFLFFKKELYEEALNKLKDSRASLFGIRVNKHDKYNETVLKDGVLVAIEKPPRPNDYITYSGLGIIKLDGLKPAPGITSFFETVANFKKERVSFVILEEFEYWDFGTAEIYLENIRKIYSNIKSSHKSFGMDFFKRHGCFSANEDNFYSKELNSVSLQGVSDFASNSIVGFGIIQKV